MPTAILVEEKVPGQPPSKGYPVTLPADRITVAQLIRIYVETQVENYNTTRVSTACGENYTSKEELLLNPAKEDKRFKPARCESEVERALVAFQANKIFLLIDGKQASELSEELDLTSSSKVTFLKLVPLVGG
ncbi:MAG: hypothetical protein K2W95_11645 [Candidatus Obscuribacterales bacterium]|nr:hypothetical protein [Candidatus Obscuribacterales bacterium]